MCAVYLLKECVKNKNITTKSYWRKTGNTKAKNKNTILQNLVKELKQILELIWCILGLTNGLRLVSDRAKIKRDLGLRTIHEVNRANTVKGMLVQKK